ncbi:hypothetical protein EV141_2221 [Microcella putealis]|uniref:Restriction system protein Mrr-like N-terminal domain-containing protein n=1 Tax=Microcella putealis TaxID=337005 RepID=A0A4Q7LNH3_9MICO|nr:hypothetical protein EV141_2221 [Microcella putealis]TQM23510.1 hypothetical protein BJ957_1876 [Microcella putealis]
MSDKSALRLFVLEALRALGGTGSVLEVSRHIWQTHEADLRMSGNLFYTWQYDVRWAAQKLRQEGLLASVNGGRTQPWALTEQGWDVSLPRPS